MTGSVRVRRDIWSLEGEQKWHPITRAYALAVADMKKRPASDPTSLAYQAQIHGMPDSGQPDRFRGQCQHRSWFFLPWHRLYLHWFDLTVLAAVRAHKDIDDETKAAWALPYWNYGLGGQRATLPEAFRQAEHPDDPTKPNPLLANRNDFVNNGDPLDPLATDPTAALHEPVFSLPKPAGGFGGAATGFNHLDQDPNRFTGMLEQTPHNDVHQEVGGDMLDFATAGLDPVFWMHHANIDRLWVVWAGQPGVTPADPTGPWGTTRDFFHDPAGNEVSGNAAGVLDTVADLEYQYEDTSMHAPPRRRSVRRVPREPPPEHPAELVGATEGPVELTGGTKQVSLSVGEPTGPARVRGSADPARAYLTVEGIAGERNPGVTYAVYVNLPDDVDVDEEPESFYAGNVSFFGIEESGRVDTDAGSHGMAVSFDITGLYSELRESGRWDSDAVTVTFVPLRRGSGQRRGSRDAEGQGPPVTVGRVGVYFQ